MFASRVLKRSAARVGTTQRVFRRLCDFVERDRGWNKQANYVDRVLVHEFHTSFSVVLHSTSFVVLMPVFWMIWEGHWQPTRILVRLGVVTQDMIDEPFSQIHPAFTGIAHTCLFFILWEMFNFIKYPAFERAVAPLWRKLGLAKRGFSPKVEPSASTQTDRPPQKATAKAAQSGKPKRSVRRSGR